MTHRVAALLTVSLFRLDHLARRARDERGQGTVEYVALILLVAGVLAAVVAWAKGSKDHTIGDAIVKQLKNAIDAVAGGR